MTLHIAIHNAEIESFTFLGPHHEKFDDIVYFLDVPLTLNTWAKGNHDSNPARPI